MKIGETKKAKQSGGRKKQRERERMGENMLLRESSFQSSEGNEDRRDKESMTKWRKEERERL